jgi:hypothetical protein
MTDTLTRDAQAIEKIQEMLGTTSKRELISSSEVADLMLDLLRIFDPTMRQPA